MQNLSYMKEEEDAKSENRGQGLSEESKAPDPIPKTTVHIFLRDPALAVAVFPAFAFFPFA